MGYRIVTNYRLQAKMAQKFNTTRAFISRALKFEYESQKAREVRSYALNQSGSFIINIE